MPRSVIIVVGGGKVMSVVTKHTGILGSQGGNCKTITSTVT